MNVYLFSSEVHLTPQGPDPPEVVEVLTERGSFWNYWEWR
jgi:hypothetical protein